MAKSEVPHGVIYWRSASSAQVANAERPIVLIPIGSIEQHGPHLPLDTDTYLAEQVVAGVAESMVTRGDSVIVAPSMPFGISPHHMGFPGSMTSSLSAFASIVIGLLRAARLLQPSKVVLVNGHGANAGAIEAVCLDALDRYGVTAGAVTYWRPALRAVKEICTSPLGGVGHGGEMETSLSLYLRPERVTEAAAHAVEDSSLGFPYDPRDSEVISAFVDIRSQVSSGVLGMPRFATKEKGEKLFHEMIESLIPYIDSVPSYMNGPSTSVSSGLELEDVRPWSEVGGFGGRGSDLE